MILAGDLGGTKTVLALYAGEGPPREPQFSRRYASGDHASFNEILRLFLKASGARPRAACFGVAGPVVGLGARITNLGWEVDAARLAQTFGLSRVHLLNDLEAVATALPHASPAAFETLHDRPVDPEGVVVLVAPGTGLGVAYGVPSPGPWTVLPSEGGHVAFAPRTPKEDALLRWARQRFGHVSVERVCSGAGIGTIHEFLVSSGASRSVGETPGAFLDALAAVDDPTPLIVDAALAGRNASAKEALDLFVAILGGVVGDLLVSLLPGGGLTLGGGIPPRILDRLREGDFLEAAHAKGRFSELVSRFPIRVILNERMALDGAAWQAWQDWRG